MRYNKRTDCSAVCSSDMWLTGTSSCNGILTVQVTRREGRKDWRKAPLGGIVNGRQYKIAGLTWQERDEISNQIDDENLWRGYAVKHFTRAYPSFMTLRLTPKCRQVAKNIYQKEGKLAMLDFLNRLQSRLAMATKHHQTTIELLLNQGEQKLVDYVEMGWSANRTPENIAVR